MALQILHSATRNSVAATTDQTAELTALRAPFVTAGSVQVRAVAANGSIRGTGTYPGWTIQSTNPRKMVLNSPLSGHTHSADVTPVKYVFVAAGVDIFEMDGVTFPGAWGPTMRANLSDPSTLGGPTNATVTASAHLPLSGATASATAFTIGFAATGTVDTPVTITVVPNGPLPTGATVTIAATVGTLSGTQLIWGADEEMSKTVTLTLSSAGSSTVTMTNNKGLTNSGSGAVFSATATVPEFTSVVLTSTNSSPPLDTLSQWVVLSLHGSGTNYDLFYGRKYTADLPPELSYETDNQFKFAIQNSTSGSTPTQMTILPSDRQENLPSGQRREMFWMGCNATPGAGNPVDMVMERRLDTLMAWFDANYPQGSTTRRVAVGGSMGAYGLMTYALKRPTKFAALYPDRTRWRSASTPNTIWVPAWSTGATNVYPFGAGPSARAEDGGFTLESHQDHLSWIANTANELPWIGWCIGSADEGTPFSDHIAAIAALRARGAGFAVYWNAGNHSVGARMNFEIYPTYPVYLWELGKGYPIFTEHSLDDDPTVDAEGGINIGLSFRNVVETSTTWSCEVRHQGTTFRPAQACTVKVKPKSWIYTGNPIPQLVNLPSGGQWTSVSF